jgi:molybdopterin-guanine dinucleotide biosynthesis protein A
MIIAGIPNAVRVGRVLAEVVSPTIEVGPGLSGLASMLERPRGGGPLVAMHCGWQTLRAAGHEGPAVVLACDLPLVGIGLVGLLARWPGTGSVVPVVGARAQPLCARWSASDLDAAAVMVAAGRRSLHELLARPGIAWIDEEAWSSVADPREFSDVDTPEDLIRLELGDLSGGAAGGVQCGDR